MKHRRNRWPAWTIVFALLCMLCACGGPTSSGQEVQTPDGLGADEGNVLSLQTPGLTAGPAGSGSDLIPLSRETDQGCYTLGGHDEGAYDLLCYVDYALAEEIPLCAQPSCAHDSDACTAFVEQGKNAFEPQIGDGSAIFFVMMDHETQQNEIWAADPNGSGHRILMHGDSGTNRHSPVAEDDAFLYYTYYFIRRAEGEEPEVGFRLARVPLAGGECEDISSWEDHYGNGVGYEFLGVSGREIAVYRYDWGAPIEIVVPEGASPEEMDAAIEAQQEKERQQTGYHSVLLVNVDTGTQRELDTWSSTSGSAGRSCLWDQGRLYWCADHTYGPVHWLDTDGQSGELPILPEKSNDENALYTLNRIVQGKILVDCYSPAADSVSRCAIDLSGDPADGGSAGSAQPLTLRYLHAVSERPVRIQGQGEAGLLVLYEESMEQSTGFYEDGTAKSNFSVTMRYGMISYEDYFANRPNYRPVEMSDGFAPR